MGFDEEYKKLQDQSQIADNVSKISKYVSLGGSALSLITYLISKHEKSSTSMKYVAGGAFLGSIVAGATSIIAGKVKDKIDNDIIDLSFERID